MGVKKLEFTFSLYVDFSIHKVEYSDNKIDVTSYVDKYLYNELMIFMKKPLFYKDISNRKVLKSLYNKSNAWGYEKEWRIISNSKEIFTLYPDTYLYVKPSIIMIGSKTENEDRKKIIKIAKDNNIAIFDVYINNDVFNYQLNFCKSKMR